MIQVNALGRGLRMRGAYSFSAEQVLGLPAFGAAGCGSTCLRRRAGRTNLSIGPNRPYFVL